MKYLSIGALALVLAGCATPAPVYDPILPHDASMAPVHELAVNRQNLPERARAVDVPINYDGLNAAAMNSQYYNSGVSPGAAAAGGLLAVLVVAAVDASVDASRNSRINGILEEQGFDAQGTFNAALMNTLEQRGIETHWLETTAESGAAATATSADAQMDVNVSVYGFQMVGHNLWRPLVVIEVTVTDLANGALLLDDRVVFGDTFSGGNAVSVVNDPRYVFEDLDHMEDDPELMVAALRFALEETAIATAALMQRPSGRHGMEAR